MFKTILLPTDGSVISNAMMRRCIEMAKETGAKVVGLHVIPDFHVFAYQPEMVVDTREQYKIDSEAHARNYLADIALAAQDAGVPCETLYVQDNEPYEAIVKVAKEKGCDLICMASHGRKGVKGLLLGSETQKVLTHSQIPVLVFR
jgi:nucleotide-binding universal stress UspA family protein